MVENTLKIKVEKQPHHIIDVIDNADVSCTVDQACADQISSTGLIQLYCDPQTECTGKNGCKFCVKYKKDNTIKYTLKQ